MRESTFTVPTEDNGSDLMSCPECGCHTLEDRFDEETFEYGGREKPFTVTARIPSKRCTECGFRFYDGAAQDARHAAACRQLGVMTPAEIRQLREEKYGLTQEEFAELTKLGVASIGRWERGVGIQNEAYDALLYLLTFPKNVERLRRRQGESLVEEQTVSNTVSGWPTDLFSADYLRTAERVFLRPAPRYAWGEIVNGVGVRGADGKTRRLAAVDPTTFRGFHRIDQDSPGAQEPFRSYFIGERVRLVDALSKVKDEYQLHQLENRVCEEVRGRLTNVKPKMLRSYNKVRKPVDLCIEHLVAMARELDPYREALIPLLFLPLDGPLLAHPALFAFGEMADHGLSRDSTFTAVETEETYKALQELLRQKAKSVAAARGRAFHRIYFDLLWEDRYGNSGGNLFELIPSTWGHS
jgi:putative zinc finger/helix-turn-helix YgiT family protein